MTGLLEWTDELWRIPGIYTCLNRAKQFQWVWEIQRRNTKYQQDWGLLRKKFLTERNDCSDNPLYPTMIKADESFLKEWHGHWAVNPNFDSFAVDPLPYEKDIQEISNLFPHHAENIEILKKYHRVYQIFCLDSKKKRILRKDFYCAMRNATRITRGYEIKILTNEGDLAHSEKISVSKPMFQFNVDADVTAQVKEVEFWLKEFQRHYGKKYKIKNKSLMEKLSAYDIDKSQKINGFLVNQGALHLESVREKWKLPNSSKEPTDSQRRSYHRLRKEASRLIAEKGSALFRWNP